MKQTYIKLVDLLKNSSKSHQNSEQPEVHLKKYPCVTSKRGQNQMAHSDITICQPELTFNHDLSVLSHETSSTNTMTNSHSMKRSMAKFNLLKKNDPNAVSIVSTADEHLKSQLQVNLSLVDMKPRLTSSMVTSSSNDTAVTFNVEFASTPKKNIPRSSTPKAQRRLKPRSFNSEKAPMSSTLIQENLRLPPPLLSSSLQSKCTQRPNPLLVLRSKSSKRAKRCLSSTRKSVHLKKIRVNKVKSNGSNKKQMPTLTIELLKRTKYSIKYFPNMKAQDIDRLNVDTDDVQMSSSCGFELNLLPIVNSNCYLYGDYKFWIV